jgi:hypothetical protein
MDSETLKLLIQNNPGLFNIILTGVILPVAILWLTNRHNRKLKSIEKELDIKYNSKEDLRKQEKMVYASLSKILFDVQQLHVSLSGTCIDHNCITDSVKKFDGSVSKYHEEISNNMLYLPSKAINLIYQFYAAISQLKLELNELNEKKTFDMAHVSVYYSSQTLADTLIELQEIFIKERDDLKVQFDKAQQQMMKYCCGTEPPDELKKKYETLK